MLGNVASGSRTRSAIHMCGKQLLQQRHRHKKRRTMSSVRAARRTRVSAGRCGGESQGGDGDKWRRGESRSDGKGKGERLRGEEAAKRETSAHTACTFTSLLDGVRARHPFGDVHHAFLTETRKRMCSGMPSSWPLLRLSLPRRRHWRSSGSPSTIRLPPHVQRAESGHVSASATWASLWVSVSFV